MKAPFQPAPLAIFVFLYCCTTPLHADHLSGGFGLDQASAVNTESAIPLTRGAWSIGLRSEYVDNETIFDDDLIDLRAEDIIEHGGAHEDLHSTRTVWGNALSVGYGATENLSVGMRIPYIRRNDIREPEEGHSHQGNPIVIHDIIVHGDSTGIGDITVFGLYRFLHNEQSDLALQFGLKIPTGENDETGFRDEVFVKRVDTGVVPSGTGGHAHSGTLLETHLQPGSGSWDPIFGLAWSRDLGMANLDSSVMYTIVTEGDQETDLGDTFAYNLAIARSVMPTVNLVLELNGEWRDREVRDNEVIDNSGGHVLYLSPGVRFAPADRWSAGLSFGKPIINDLNGVQSDPDFRIVGALSFEI